MKKTLFLLFLFFHSSTIFAQFEKYYSDDAPSSSNSAAMWIGITVIIALLIFGDKNLKKSVIYFCALFALPAIFAKIGFLLFGMLGVMLGVLLGCYLWFKLGSWLDSD
jgi:uncharacterized integral membrane protein